MSVAIEIAGGVIVGYLVASFGESLLHQFVSDAPMRYVRRWKKFPRLFRYLIRTHFSHHAIHHLKTFTSDHVTQFQHEDERTRLDEILKRRGRHGKIIMESNYAMKLHGSGTLVFSSPIFLIAPMFFLLFGQTFALSSMPMLIMPPLLSNFVHPYLHMNQKEAIEKAPFCVAVLLSTWYGRAMARSHFMHHRYGDCHYNLLLGADLLRGKTRKPSDTDIQEMVRIGIPVH